MASTTVEDYIKALLLLEQRHPNQRISNSQLSEALQLTPGSTSAKVKLLAQAGLINLVHRQGMTLTDEGRLLGMGMLRRHRLTELFLVQTLSISWDEVHQEAEILEHAISDRVLDAIDAHLGHPTHDPHGDPIPCKNGTLPAHACIRLSQCPLRTPLRLARVQDDAPELLRHLKTIHLTPGTSFSITQHIPALGTFELQLGNQTITLGTHACQRMYAEVLSGASHTSPNP